MNIISIAQAFEQWKELAADIPRNDHAMLAESWNDYTDSLCKDGQLGALQYHYCPAFDDQMPEDGERFDTLSGDREFILAAMNVTLDATFVPFSQSRNKSEKQPSLNWRVTLKKDGREVITTDYMQGCAHAPAYKTPVTFSDGNRDERSTNKAIKQECETGKRVKQMRGIYYLATGSKIDPPDVADVLFSLLRDADALNCRDFADWCADLGCDDDSTKARATYDACIETATKLRAAFGDQTLRDLNELFEDM